MRNRIRSITSRSRINHDPTMEAQSTVTWIGSLHSLPAGNHRNTSLTSRDNKARTATTIIPIDFRCIGAGAGIAGRVVTCRAGGQTNPRRTTTSSVGTTRF
jgi:hypothetical protein